MSWLAIIALAFLRFTLYCKELFSTEKTIFIICPVRDSGSEVDEFLKAYKRSKEAEGYSVYYPKDDTEQEGDPIGTRICHDNGLAIFRANEVHIYWASTSEGSKFDLGELFMLTRILGLRKKIFLINPADAPIQCAKHFNNVAHAMEIGEAKTMELIAKAKKELR